MAAAWEPNEEINEEEELAVTEHRDSDTPAVDPEDETGMHTTVDTGKDVLDEFGEDVSSSPSERGQAESSWGG